MKFEPLRTIKYYYLRFIRLQGNPHVIARGVAIGIFVGITPTIPFHTIMVFLLCFILRGSKIAALLLTFIVSNPLTFFFQYYFSWRLGNWITLKELSWAKACSVLKIISSTATFTEIVAALGQLGQDTVTVLILGGIVLALPFALAGYLFSYHFFSLLKKRRQKRSESRAVTK